MEVPCVLWLLALSAALPSHGHPPTGGPQFLDWMELELKFRSFMEKYGKFYKDQEEEGLRFKIFAKNMEKARKLQEEERGTAQYGITKFSDLSEEEFSSGSLRPASTSVCDSFTIQSNGNNLPDSKDWRHVNAVTEVKNQGKACKACWDFAVVSNVESQWAIKTQNLTVLSTQELLDCSKAGNCSFGFIDRALRRVVEIGLVSENNYRYTGNVGECHRDRSPVAVKIKRCFYLKGGELKMKHYVAQNGTITTLVDLTPLQHYTSGILRRYHRTNDQQIHAVMIAGYGVEGNQPFWIVKNSWGTDWGENGYVRIYRGENTCGIAEYPMSAEV